jgi:hypothetical protein
MKKILKGRKEEINEYRQEKDKKVKKENVNMEENKKLRRIEERKKFGKTISLGARGSVVG